MTFDIESTKINMSNGWGVIISTPEEVSMMGITVKDVKHGQINLAIAWNQGTLISHSAALSKARESELLFIGNSSHKTICRIAKIQYKKTKEEEEDLSSYKELSKSFPEVCGINHEEEIQRVYYLDGDEGVIKYIEEMEV